MAPTASGTSNSTPTVSPFVRLAALLDTWNAGAAEVVAPPTGAFAERLDRYIAARDRFLAGMMLANEGRPLAAMNTLLESVRTSADFRTAYVTCLQMAIESSHRNPEQARDVLRKLRDARPEDRRAATQLRRLFGE